MASLYADVMSCILSHDAELNFKDKVIFASWSKKMRSFETVTVFYWQLFLKRIYSSLSFKINPLAVVAALKRFGVVLSFKIH